MKVAPSNKKRPQGHAAICVSFLCIKSATMKYLVHNFLFNNVSGKDVPKIKQTIISHLKGNDIIQILNLYIHYPNPVDEQILLSSWNSMKYYISACLK